MVLEYDVSLTSLHFRMILDFDPFRMVERRGFAMDMRLNMPHYKIHTHHFYAGLVEKVII